MDKLTMYRPDLTQANIDKLAELFPNCVAEAANADGVVKRSIDFDQLRQELSGSSAGILGYGIYQMHMGQARRYFPMPDYDLSEANVTRMTLYGGVIDQAYSEMLMQKTSLPLADILALDRVQKKLPLDDEMVKHLRHAGLIEGRKPNLYVSASVAKVTDSKATYIRMRAQDDDYYAKLIMDYLQTFGHASRSEMDGLILSKLSDALDDEQKLNKISNLLTNLRRAGKIKNTGPRKTPRWTLAG